MPLIRKDPGREILGFQLNINYKVICTPSLSCQKKIKKLNYIYLLSNGILDDIDNFGFNTLSDRIKFRFAFTGTDTS